MDNQQTQAIVDLIIENLHLFDYTVMNMDEDTVTLKHGDKISSMPTDKFISFFHIHISFMKHMLDKLTT